MEYITDSYHFIIKGSWRFNLEPKSLITFAVNVLTEEKISFDINRIISGRLFVQADSGGGKSYMLRSIMENAYGLIQMIIFDLGESEYMSLKEEFDFVLIGRSTEEQAVDVEINMKYINKLAEEILRTKANVIIDLYELDIADKRRFVKIFIDTMMKVNKSLQHPTFIFIDEIDLVAPESEAKDAKDSLDSISRLSSKGRKRGFALIAATQNIANFNKDVARHLKTSLIGNCTLDIDMDRARKVLGFRRDRMHELRELGEPNFHFFALGQALLINGVKSNNTISKIKSLPVKTSHEPNYQREARPFKITEELTRLTKILNDCQKNEAVIKETQNKVQEFIKETKSNVVNYDCKCECHCEKPICDCKGIACDECVKNHIS